MKVEEIIKELKKYPKTMEVLVDGYEWGFDGLSINSILTKRLIKIPSPYYGGEYDTPDNEEEGEKMLILSRYKKDE